MTPERAAKLQPIFDDLNPAAFHSSEFPGPDDDGEGDGSISDIASIIYYGALCEISECHLEFAMQLGRALEKAGIDF